MVLRLFVFMQFCAIPIVDSSCVYLSSRFPFHCVCKVSCSLSFVSCFLCACGLQNFFRLDRLIVQDFYLFVKIKYLFLPICKIVLYL